MPGVRSVEISETVGVGTRFKWKAGPAAIKSQVIEPRTSRDEFAGWRDHDNAYPIAIISHPIYGQELQ
jgi:hypothetical protein